MSHPVPGHDYGDNEYPSDSPHKGGGENSYPQRKRRAKKSGPLHNVANRLTARARALRKQIEGK